MVGSECALESAPFPLMTIVVLGGVLVPDGKGCVFNVNDDLAAAQRNKKIDNNHFHVSLAHAHLGVLNATAQQHGIRLVDELTPYYGFSQAKEIYAPTPHHTTARARASVNLIKTDTVVPYPESLGGSRDAIMFVDSTCCLSQPKGTQDKSAPAMLAVTKHVVVDMGEFLARSGPIMVRNTRTGVLTSTVVVSGSAAS